MKKLSKNLLILVAATLCVGVASLNPGLPADEGGQKVEVRKVPLESIYSTNGQEGLKEVSDGFQLDKVGNKKYDEPYGAALAEIYLEFRGGASNVFLARGDDITAAVDATWEVLIGRRGADKPVSYNRLTKSDRIWFVAFLGVDGSGPAWVVESAEIRADTVRLSYRKKVTEFGDLHQYHVWVPLSKLGSGVYTLELFDKDKQEVILSRRVTIPKK